MSGLALFAALAVAAVAIGLVASWLHYGYWVRRFTLDVPYESVERIPTGDGSFVELRRLPSVAPRELVDEGSDESEDDRPPVLLVHGIALNHRNNDLTEDISLGRALGRSGRDVWLLTLRCGRDDLPWREERLVSFERMARYDLAAGIEAVLERTGARQLDYVGFSMGGILLYAAIGRTVPAEHLRRVAIIGSPAKIEAPFAILSKIARFVPHWLVPTLRLRLVGRMLAFMSEWFKTPIHHWIYQVDNVDRGMAPYAMVNGFVNIPYPLASEFVRWAASDGAVRYGGEKVIDGLRAVSTPVFFVAGAADRLAPPHTVRLAYDAWGEEVEGVDKAFRVVGIEGGAAADYGHGDLAIGRFAEQDVFDPVRAFLAG
ncbi:MAG: lipase family alpha/beta hydrolase [Sandaracinaceae bacterium]